MATMFQPDLRARLEERVRSVGPDSVRRWGGMTAHQAICHLADGFRMALRERPVAELANRYKPLLRLVALRLPMRWPRGIQTMPEVRQGRAARRRRSSSAIGRSCCR